MSHQWTETHGDFADWFKPFLLKVTNRLVAFKAFDAHKGNLPCATDDAYVWLVTKRIGYTGSGSKAGLAAMGTKGISELTARPTSDSTAEPFT